MHIAMLLASQGAGGLEKHVRELSAALVAQGQQVTVLADAAFLATLAAGVGRCPIDMQRSRWHPRLWWQVWQQVQRLKPDLVHAHANKAVAILASLRFWLALPRVGTVHNLKQQRGMYRHMQAVIAPSHSLAQSLAHTKGHVVYHGVSMPAVSEDSGHQHLKRKDAVLHPLARPFTLCAIGRLVAAKGLDQLLQAVDGLPLTLKIAGEGPARSALTQAITLLHPQTTVELLGQVDDIASLLTSCDGLVIASRREGFAYVCAEALMREVPVIATEVPVANEILPTQWLVPVNDVQALRAAIVRAMRNPEYWRDSQRGAFALVRQQCQVPVMAAETVKVYQSVLSAQA